MRPGPLSVVREVTRARFLRAMGWLAASVAMRPVAGFGQGRGAFLGGEGFPYRTFDQLPATDVDIGGAVIHVAFMPGDLVLPKARVIARVRLAATAVSLYYGHFPVASMRLLFVPVDDEGVIGGTTWGYAGAATGILIGTETDEDELHRDWIITHEMIHTALPDISRRYLWLAEGFAVYIEPVARVQAGEMPAASIWSDMKRDMPKGLPREGDQGLDHTPTWGRTYWGGAIFCLLADVQIRQKTENRLGLQDAMRGVLAAGGNHEVDWPIDKILATADQVTGTTVLADLYEAMRATPVSPDLDKLWRDLGVDGEPGDVKLNDHAPLAAIRMAITRPIAS